MTDPRAIADEMLALLGSGRSTTTVTSRDPEFDAAAGYAVVAPLRALREARGEVAVGRKIGFTNRSIWPLYDIDAPIWGYVYDTTLFDLATMPQPFAVAGFSELRIEPEIVFGLKAAPRAGMSGSEILRCCEWVAHGFEMVHSVFPGWKFKPADTIAAHGLHGALLVGPRHPVGDDPDRWERELASFTVELICNGEVRERGGGAKVLGSPVLALKHLVEELAQHPQTMPPLEPGEVVTTGTLTDVRPVAAGEAWSTRLSGIRLEDAALSFG